MTPERIGRGDDEKLYQPRIHSQWIRELYQIKTETGDPITVLVDRALAEFIERRKRKQEEDFPETGASASSESSE